MIAYRDATAGDLAAVDAFFRDSFSATFAHLYDPADLAAFLAGMTAEAWRAELAEPLAAIRLAERDGALVGYAKVGQSKLPYAPSGPALELRQLYVAESVKGGGVAQALMGWVIDRARTGGAREVLLGVYADNPRARRFYARHGFERVGGYGFPVGRQIDEEDIMRLTL